MLSVIIFIIVLSLLVLVHEFGHFIVAKKVGMRVDEFAIGFPPTLFSFKKGETKYSFNILLLGGFVKIFGENPDEDSINGADSKRSFVNKPRKSQAAVLVAGVLFNVLFAWTLLSSGLMYGLPLPAEKFEDVDVKSSNVTITSVLGGSPADLSGLKVGDEILFVGSSDDAIQKFKASDVQNFISAKGDKGISILYKRGGNTFTSFITPKEGLVENKVVIGISMEDIAIIQMPFYKAIWGGLKLTGDIFIGTVVGLAGFIGGIFSGGVDFSSVSGPVGIVGLVGSAAVLGFTHLLIFTAFISINLAVINLIPFPALDGGRLVFVAIESIKGSPIKPVITNTLNLIGFLLLIILMIVVTYHDIIKLF